MKWLGKKKNNARLKNQVKAVKMQELVKRNIQRASTRTEKCTNFFGINANSSTPEYEPARECKVFGECKYGELVINIDMYHVLKYICISNSNR